jgi:hypothetical protein
MTRNDPSSEEALNCQICAHSNNAAHGTGIPPNARTLFCNG